MISDQDKLIYCIFSVFSTCTEDISKRKRPVMAPGEMEQVILDKKKLGEYPDLSKITIKIEEA